MQLVEPSWSPPLHLSEVVDELHAIERGEQREFCLSVPPRHGKTSLLIVAIAWMIARHPDWRILYVSYSTDTAKVQTRHVREYARALGCKLGGASRQDYFDTRAGGSVATRGLDGQITGLGFNLVIVDDPHKGRNEAESRTMRDQVERRFSADIYTRKLPASRMSTIVSHTRWHIDDLIGRLTTGSDGRKRWPLINKPALSASGEALAPWLFTTSQLETTRDDGTISRADWASLYQGSPIPSGGAVFSQPTLVQRRPDRARYTIGIDLAYTVRKRSDYSAAVVMAHDGDVKTIVDVRRAQGLISDNRADFISALMSLAREYPGAQFCAFPGPNEEVVVRLLEAQGVPHIASVTASRDKVSRAQRYSDAWASGKVGVLAGQKWTSDFLAEHAGFTGADGDHDDMIDAAVAAFEMRAGGSIWEHEQKRGATASLQSRREKYT